MGEHTPGPWIVRSQDALYSEGGIYEILNPFRHLPNEKIERPWTSQVMDANCQLIAAAPDLLEEGIQNERFLLQLIDLGVELPEPWDGILIERANRTRAAVAKAKGE